MRHLLDTTDLSLEEVDGIISTAIDIINNKEKYAHFCDNVLNKTTSSPACGLQPTNTPPSPWSFSSLRLKKNGVNVKATFVMVDRKEKGQGEKSAMAEVTDEFGFPVYSVVDVYDIIEYLEEDEANKENVDRIKAYLAVNGAKE